MGLPDWRAPALTEAIASVFARTRHELDAADTRSIEQFIGAIDERFAQVAQCGLPDTLVHGDYHPGNVRGQRGQALELTVLDWGDAGVGQPLLDCPAFMDRGQPPDQLTLREHWQNAWQAVYPNANPRRAWDLLKPIAAARQASIYRHFLDQIEPAEHPYHRDDPRESLQRVAAILRQERD